MTVIHEFLTRLGSADAILVRVHSHRGSVPREAGAWMAVFAQSSVGTIGGGHLEWQASAQARAQLQGQPIESPQRFALGSSLGQCCGGDVLLRFERVSAADIARLQADLTQQQQAWPQVALFGAGHVGQALVRVLAHLPLQVHWVDSRDEVFPLPLPDTVSTEHSQPVQMAVTSLRLGTMVLVMSFSHAEDLDVVAACLTRQRAQADLAFIGLMGSRTKWASFSHRLLARGFTLAELAQVTCPIGLAGIVGKAPDVIAVSVAAQLLQVVSQRTT
ncbi:MAG: xanthine dehydrogenase accessory protein XdhC [Comamonadaceae bacterium CG_4_9_14_0_8_um_filter_57_21]|nr:MAG: xanthine dehydrogenase accessory protein XdhC [Comamonadaceae bacterium CG_4_9_14_0_8_um_filter_57_21]